MLLFQRRLFVSVAADLAGQVLFVAGVSQTNGLLHQKETQEPLVRGAHTPLSSCVPHRACLFHCCVEQAARPHSPHPGQSGGGLGPGRPPLPRCQQHTLLTSAFPLHRFRGLLAAAKRLGYTNHFLWVASDGWGRQHKLVEGLEDVAEGALTVDLQSQPVPGFYEYMLSLTPKNNGRNPWYADYWQELHNCVLPPSSQSTTAPASNGSAPVCGDKLDLAKIVYELDTKTQFVVDAVYAFAHAISALHRDACHGRRGACPALLSYDGGDFYSKYLLNVSFFGNYQLYASLSFASITDSRLVIT